MATGTNRLETVRLMTGSDDTALDDVSGDTLAGEGRAVYSELPDGRHGQGRRQSSRLAAQGLGPERRRFNHQGNDPCGQTLNTKRRIV
jgi:hypothetical protein